jgi:type IV pilus assembly protein PilA
MFKCRRSRSDHLTVRANSGLEPNETRSITMLEKLRKDRGEEGFTLIELLVVIIIIGILAAIAIPVFLNQRSKGWDAAVQSDLRNAATAQETSLTENNPGTYVDEGTLGSNADAIDALKAAGFKPSADGNYATDAATNLPLFNMQVEGDGGQGYCMISQSQSGNWFWYDSVGGPGKNSETDGAPNVANPPAVAGDAICTP